MISAAANFVNQWVENNIHATGYEPEGDATEARRQALACWAAADSAGINRGDIEAEFGPLVDHMAAEIERVNSEEVERLVSKSD